MSFGKDILLLVLILILLFTVDRVPAMMSETGSITIVFISLLATAALQWYVLKNLPLVDCLPYKKGNDIVQQMQTPEGAIPDSFAIVFKYKKDGKAISFDQTSFPDDFDSTYEYIDREDKLVRKGNGLTAKIVDFTLQNFSGEDTTQAVFSRKEDYVLVLAQDMSKADQWKEEFIAQNQQWTSKGVTVLLVTADAEKARSVFPEITLLKGDATVIKTAARVNPTYFLMNGSLVKEKLPAGKATRLIP